jgi:formamidopyrimidine-DNA glycosylase
VSARIAVAATAPFGADVIDPRRFARVRRLSLEEFGHDLGPDLLEEVAPKKPAGRRSIKAALLDQRIVAGVGNYLADEALWRARIDPRRPLSTITGREWRLVLEKARATALASLEHGGVTLRDYRGLDGASGEGLRLLNCYGRAGLQCRRCPAILERATVASRGTTYCPSCQR